MATVYLAEDLKHHRKVAVKVLRPELAAVLGAERFLKEIEVTANLQHPHILPLFDSGEADSFLYYVMPHVEGESLRDRLNRDKQLPVGEAVNIAEMVASALDYAHRHDIVHRDIKPENILLHDEQALVADFGIALAVSAAAGARMTETGLSLGTPHYMSPEQATADRDITGRSDVYSLACVTYEMLAGDPPYLGNTAQAIIAKIISDAPRPVGELRATVPAHVELALHEALEKLPADRFATAKEFAEALANPAFTLPTTQAAVVAGAAASGPWNRLSMAFAGSTGVLALALGWALLSPSQEVTAVPFRMGLTDFEVRAMGGSGVRLAISRDGSQIAVASVLDGVSRLFLRRSDVREFVMIPGTEDATHPTFSPDGQWLAFTQDAAIKRVKVVGGPVLQVWEQGNNAHWGLDETIVIPVGQELYMVSPSGEEQASFTVSDSTEVQRPFLLPDGDAVVFQAGTSSESARLMLLDIESGMVTDLGLDGNDPQYVPTGHLVYGHSSQRLMAAPFDLGTQRVTGVPTPVATGVLVYGGGATQFAVAETGTALIGLPSQGYAGEGRQLALVDGRGSETPMPLDQGYFGQARFAPDGRRIAYEEDGVVGVYDRETGANRLFRGAGGNSRYPFWSRDGQFVYYAHQDVTTLGYEGFRRRFDGTGDAEPLFRRPGNNYPLSLSPDGTQLLLQENTPERGYDLVIMTDDGDSVSFADYLRADWNEVMGTISPEGTRVAYVSDESGMFEVYVRAFPDAQDRVKVSEGGGTEPVWGPNGSVIYYRNGTRIMRAAVASDVPFAVTASTALFEGVWTSYPYNTSWDVHPNNESFLVIVRPGAKVSEGAIAVSLIDVEFVVNWFEELKERMGT